MKCLRGTLTPLALAILIVGCSSTKQPSQNGVAGPTGGAPTTEGTGGTSSTDATGGTTGVESLGGTTAASTPASDSGLEDAATPVADAGATFDGSCATLPGKIVYIESGDTQENLLKNLGRHLRDTANITLVFNLTGSCTLTNDIYTGAKVVPNGTLKYIPSTAENPSWTPSAAEPTCTTGAAGVSIDVAISALFVESCGLGGPPAGSGLGLIQGPIQAYTFIAPTASSQNAIWAEEAYYAFGFGAANPLAPTYNPWNNESFMFIRPSTKSTLVATAKNISVPPSKWKGVQEAASSDVVTAVSTSVQPDPTIGILGAEVYDSNRSKGIKTLAFQAFNQNAAYYPDSTSTGFDKQNLRDGHYTLWSPTVYIANVDSSNVPTNPAVKYIIDLVLGNAAAKPPSGGTAFDGLADVVKVGLIPECAMRVTRSVDGGDLSPYSPTESCTCYYLSKIPGASGTPTGCKACSSTTDCGAGTCNHGFCEPDAMSTAGTPSSTCYSGTPSTHADIINACTNAPGIVKTVVLPAGGLTPLP